MRRPADMAVQHLVEGSKAAAHDLLVRCKQQTAAEAAAAAAEAGTQQQQQGGGAPEPPPPPAAGATSPAVDDLVASALGLLTTVQRCTAGEVLPGTVVAGALDSALAGLRSKVVGNGQLVDQVAASLATLKFHLTKLLTV